MPHRKKILIVHSDLHIGGAEEVTANLCNRIDKNKFDVTVCYLKEKGTVGDKIEAQGTPVSGLPGKKKGKVDYFTSLKLRKFIKQNNIELLHSHDLHAFSDCSICRLTLPKLKFVHTFHFGNFPNREIADQKIERLFWRVPDQLISVSNNQQAGVRQLYGIPENRIKTIWNGVDIESEESEVEIVNHYRKQGRVIIGSINTLIEQKGMFDLIAVAEKLKQRFPGRFVFLVAGDGHLKDKLNEMIEKKGLQDEIVLLGWVENASAVLLPHLDIFFQPSLWEAMSMVLLEAMAAGKAIIATSVGETPFILENDKHGKVVEPGNVEQLLHALESMIDNPKLRLEYGINARSNYSESFTASKMAERYEQLYESIINKTN